MTPKPLRIGALIVDFPVLLAPMAGYTDAVMRLMARRYNCGMTYTEVTSADGLARGSSQSLQMLQTAAEDCPVAAHIYGTNPDIIVQAAVIIEKMGRFQTIDLNCGCPVAKIMRKGAGAALMKNPDKIAAIVKALTKAVKLPITVKTRLGLTPDCVNILEIAQAVEESGASAIAIHTRCADGRHAGRTDWPILMRIKAERSIPVIGNGGVAKAEDALRMFKETGVDGVMIGKAAIGNPWIFRETWALLHAQPIRRHSRQEHRDVIEEHLRLFIAHKERSGKAKRRLRFGAELSAVLHFRAHLAGYIKGFRNSAAVRQSLQSMRRMEDVMAAVDGLLACEIRPKS